MKGRKRKKRKGGNEGIKEMKEAGRHDEGEEMERKAGEEKMARLFDDNICGETEET